jgi:prepilin-type N-terminal cleavage/methylation domain-containing protein
MRDLFHMLRHPDEGFTLVELLISLALMGFVLSAAYLLLNTVSGDSNIVQARSQAVEENRHAMEVISTEIRQAVEEFDSAGVFKTMGATDCTFTSDVDHDGVPELVRYYLSSGKLYKDVKQHTKNFPPYTFSATSATGYPKIVCSAVTNTDIFTYLDQSSPTPLAVTSLPDIAAVTIHIVDTATVSGAVGTSDVTTWVKIRSVHNTIIQ